MMVKILVCALCLAISPPARATLGEHEASVERDRAAIGATLRTAQSAGALKFHEMSAHGNTVREYVDAGGKVYAVAWRGMADPDLSSLLGPYFAELQAARAGAALPRRGRRPALVATSNLTYQKSGHPRDFRAVVYLKAGIPAGVSARDLK
jgi:hypothetical protein